MHDASLSCHTSRKTAMIIKSATHHPSFAKPEAVTKQTINQNPEKQKENSWAVTWVQLTKPVNPTVHRKEDRQCNGLKTDLQGHSAIFFLGALPCTSLAHFTPALQCTIPSLSSSSYKRTPCHTDSTSSHLLLLSPPFTTTTLNSLV